MAIFIDVPIFIKETKTEKLITKDGSINAEQIIIMLPSENNSTIVETVNGHITIDLAFVTLKNLIKTSK